jgi:hypothetical protein
MGRPGIARTPSLWEQRSGETLSLPAGYAAAAPACQSTDQLAQVNAKLDALLARFGKLP